MSKVDRDYDVNPDRGFWDWMDEVNKVVEAKCGLSLMDLPDMDYAGAYEDGVEPDEYAGEVLADAGWYDD